MTWVEVPPAPGGEGDDQTDLRSRITMLEKTIRERDVLIGMVSHEVRNPLTTIFGNAHLLLRKMDAMDIETRNLAISDIQQEAERLNNLVQNMLLLVRSENQALTESEPILASRLIDEAVSEHRRRFGGRWIFSSVKPGDLMLEGNADYSRQVLQNLLNNAEKYSPEEERIDITARPHGGAVRISVFDRGSGVDPEESEIVFQPFFRSDRTARKVGGAGIGLAVCKMLVQAQLGSIAVHQRRGGGSVFRFSLPAISPGTECDKPSRPPRKAQGADRAGNAAVMAGEADWKQVRKSTRA